ncbi:alpha/beta hydrolase family protein [Georgenia sp. Z1344]|uniref:alpha/beta hydrolase family protein n=1 Tax=Georgenia sp. Z1344 TaxID=3416706 RepID=UPI003CED07D6
MSADEVVPHVRPHGTWPWPVPVNRLTAGTRVAEPRLDDRGAWWTEQRPADGGRTTLVHRPLEGEVTDRVVTRPDGSLPDVASDVHGYGGLAYAVGGGVVVVSDRSDSRLHGVVDGHVLTPLTPDDGSAWGDLELDLARDRVLAVRSAPGADGDRHRAQIVAVPLDGSAADDPDVLDVLLEGRDFLTSPRLSPAGDALAHVAWDHPEMPWTGGEVLVSLLDDDGRPGPSARIAGGAGVAASQPVWTSTGELVHADDSTGWQNLYRTEAPTTEERRKRDLHPVDSEFAPPQWGLGPRTIAELDDEHLVCTWVTDDRWHLGTVRLANGEAEEWVTGLEAVGPVAAGFGRVLAVLAGADRPPALYELQVGAGRWELVAGAATGPLAPGDVAHARSVAWTGDDGEEVHGFYYPPTSERYTGPEGELPPLVVVNHGGPTASTTATWNGSVQSLTTRGIAVLDVIHRGSTGRGRAYADRLDGQWGVVDVADVASGARHLAESGIVDPDRMAVRGASAGGYTTLAALAFTDVFSAGISRYGIGDLRMLAEGTHDFESRYLDRLVGPLPEAAATYDERSPIRHVDRITAAVLLLQGDEDRVVPLDQATSVADALRAAGRDVELVVLEGEGHGFRSTEAIVRAAEAEIAFLDRVWGLSDGA